MSHKPDSNLQTLKNVLGIGELDALHLVNHSAGTVHSCRDPKEMLAFVHKLMRQTKGKFDMSEYIITDDKDLSIKTLLNWMRENISEK